MNATLGGLLLPLYGVLVVSSPTPAGALAVVRAIEGFLESNASRDDEGVLWLSRLFLYYRGDFGGRSGIYDFLERYGVVHPGERPTVRYQEYDWTLNRGMYRE